MGNFTFIPLWVVQDLLVYIIATITIFWIIKKESNPQRFLMEMLSFVFLYAAVFENFATVIGIYGYGKSLLMVFNVPLSVPVIEFLLVYCGLHVLDKTKMPAIAKPFALGLVGSVFDFTLDPTSVSQIYTTAEGTIGRWTWFTDPTALTIFNEPIANFSGWIFLCGYGAAFLMLGRWWYKKSGEKPLIGYIYPVVTMLAALAVYVFPPTTTFLMFLSPIYAKGQVGEWYALVGWDVACLIIWAVAWRGKMKEVLSWKEDYAAYIVLGIMPLINVFFSLLTGDWTIMVTAAVATVLLWVSLVLASSKKGLV